MPTKMLTLFLLLLPLTRSRDGVKAEDQVEFWETPIHSSGGVVTAFYHFENSPRLLIGRENGEIILIDLENDAKLSSVITETRVTALVPCIA